ncbi:MAG: DUF58 domain-containing protein, partial [Ilumatobacteraceae bacterium]
MSNPAGSAAARLSYPIPTAWFAAAVAVPGLGLLAWPGRSWSVMLVVESLLAALFVTDAVRCTSPHRIAVTRDAPDSVTVGEPAVIVWTVENRTDRVSRVVMADALWPSLHADRRRVELNMAPRARARVRTLLQPARRGRFPLDEVTVRTTGPMRLVCRQAARSVPGSMRVMPAYPSRDEVRRRLHAPRVLEGLGSRRSVGVGTEFDQLRDFNPDDEFRNIDWASTMRFQRPIVKQYRTERNQNVVVLLDNGRVMAGTVGGVARVEHGMDAVLAVTQAACTVGDRVGLVTFDRQVRSIVVSSSSRRQLDRMAEAMFMLEPDLTESAYTAAFSAAAARFTRRALYIVITDLVEATVDEVLVPALPILTRRHLVVVGGVQDPAVAEWAGGPTTNAMHRWPSEAFRQAAAVAAQSRRERAVARLSSAGAVVVDAAPGRLGIELVDTYLRL